MTTANSKVVSSVLRTDGNRGDPLFSHFSTCRDPLHQSEYSSRAGVRPQRAGCPCTAYKNPYSKNMVYFSTAHFTFQESIPAFSHNRRKNFIQIFACVPCNDSYFLQIPALSGQGRANTRKFLWILNVMCAMLMYEFRSSRLPCAVLWKRRISCTVRYFKTK